MADNNSNAKGEKLHRDLEAHHKKTEACKKQLEKIGLMSKKALQAAKKVDELWK
jgi:hypothetical protein